MARWKTISIALGITAASLCAGIWIGDRRANRIRDEHFTALEYLSVEHRVKVIELIYEKDFDKAIKASESRLNTEILTLDPNPYDPRPLDDSSRSALLLAAKHRAKYPFVTNSPGTDKMVQEALRGVN
jgi:hypothetical protein